MLVLHLNRSSYYGHASKNPCRVIYPEILDLTPYTTSGSLSTQPSSPISTPQPPNGESAGSSNSISSAEQQPSPPPIHRVLYQLTSLVCHYGAHTFGHYIAYRRKPIPLSDPSQHTSSLRFVDGSPGTGKGWLRISDDSVEEIGIERVLSENGGTFMLFYERIDEGGVEAPSVATEMIQMQGGIKVGDSDQPLVMSRASTPRIVRSVSAGIIARPRDKLMPLSSTSPSTPILTPTSATAMPSQNSSPMSASQSRSPSPSPSRSRPNPPKLSPPKTSPSPPIRRPSSGARF